MMIKLTKSFVLVAMMFTSVALNANTYLDGHYQASLNKHLTYKHVAHSGGTDQYGCHFDRRTGTRHCH